MAARNERGIALAVALYALVLGGALVAGMLFVGTQDQRMGENEPGVRRAFGRAEQGVNSLVTHWNPQVYNQIPQFPGAPLGVADSASSGFLYNLNSNAYFAAISATDSQSHGSQRRGSGARQSVGMLMRIAALDLNTRASLTTQGNIKLSGNAAVDGHDHTPNASWSSCDAPDSGMAGIRVPPASTIQTNGNASVSGYPAIQRDTAIHSTTFTDFGSATYDALAANATLQFPGGQTLHTAPVVSNGVCNTSDATNWGDGLDRSAPCGNYFPVIHIAGDVTLNNTQGQGILLVDGDLSVQGSYEWFGVVIAKGSIKTAGGGNTAAHFWGMVMAANVDLDIESITGNAVLNYSECAINEVLRWTSSVSPTRSRSFVQLY